MNVIDEIPAETLSTCADLVALLKGVEPEHLNKRGRHGLFRVLSMVGTALDHLEENHRFERVKP